MKGAQEFTYWTARVAEEEGVRSEALFAALSGAIARLEASSDFLHSVVTEGGSANFFVGLFGSGNLGLSLPAGLLSQLASLGVGLELDVYP